jgi:hypothetical protein
MEDRVGIEPTTYGLRVRGSTAELPVHIGTSEWDRTTVNGSTNRCSTIELH